MIQDRETSSLPQRLSDTVRRWSAEAPDSLALSQAGTTFTYRQLADAIDQNAAELRDGGIRPGDRLMIVAENCIAQMVLIFAAARIDAWAVNVNARLSDRELDAISAHSQPRRIVYTVQVSSEAQAHDQRSEEHTSELQSLMRITYAVFCL